MISTPEAYSCQTLLIVLGVEVVGAVAGHEQQGVVVGGALGAAHDDAGRGRRNRRTYPYRSCCTPRRSLRSSASSRWGSCCSGSPTRCRSPTRACSPRRRPRVRLRLLTALFTFHLDGVAYIVAVLLHDSLRCRIRPGSCRISQSSVSGLMCRMIWVPTAILLGGGHGVAVHTGGLPLPSFVASRKPWR